MSSKYSISAASRITGKGRATIRRHLDDGTLSCGTDKKGNRVIDASELMRVYGDDCDFEREEGTKNNSNKKSPTKTKSGDIDELKAQYEARIEQCSATIERLEKELDQAHDRDRDNQESYKQSLRLLEDHTAKATSGEEWKSAFSTIEEKLAKHEQESATRSEKQIAELEEVHKRKLAHMRQQLENERNKSIWKKLFG